MNFPKQLLPLVFAALAIQTGSSEPPPADAEALKQKVAGTYQLNYSGTLLSLNAVKSYHQDGRYESKGTASLLGVSKKLIHKGRWKMEGDEIIYLLTESSTPKQAPVGVPLRFRVLSVDAQTLNYRDEEKGKSYREVRLK